MPSEGSKRGAQEGRRACDICNHCTEGQPVVLLYDPREPEGHQVTRMHVSCAIDNPEVLTQALEVPCLH